MGGGVLGGGVGRVGRVALPPAVTATLRPEGLARGGSRGGGVVLGERGGDGGGCAAREVRAHALVRNAERGGAERARVARGRDDAEEDDHRGDDAEGEDIPRARQERGVHVELRRVRGGRGVAQFILRLVQAAAAAAAPRDERLGLRARHRRANRTGGRSRRARRGETNTRARGAMGRGPRRGNRSRAKGEVVQHPGEGGGRAGSFVSQPKKS